MVAEESRAAYAEALATATEFSRSIVRQSTDLLAQAGIPYPGRYLSALIHSTVDHALTDAGSQGPGEPLAESTADPGRLTTEPMYASPGSVARRYSIE